MMGQLRTANNRHKRAVLVASKRSEKEASAIQPAAARSDRKLN